MENQKKDSVADLISVICFIIIAFTLLSNFTEIEIFKWYWFILILIISFLIGALLTSFLLFRILIYSGFAFLLYNNYFLIENKDLGMVLLKTFIITLFGTITLRSLIYLSPFPYLEKNIGTLTLLEMKASKRELTYSETLRLFISNIISGFLSIKSMIFSGAITFFIWLIFF